MPARSRSVYDAPLPVGIAARCAINPGRAPLDLSRGRVLPTLPARSIGPRPPRCIGDRWRWRRGRVPLSLGARRGSSRRRGRAHRRVITRRRIGRRIVIRRRRRVGREPDRKAEAEPNKRPCRSWRQDRDREGERGYNQGRPNPDNELRPRRLVHCTPRNGPNSNGASNITVSFALGN